MGAYRQPIWYDGLGRRVSKLAQATGAQVPFQYDEAGHLLGRYNASVRRRRGDGLSRRSAGGGAGGRGGPFYIAPDYLGAPHQITNGAQQVVWFWDHDPFGNGQPTGALSSTYKLRFPGQFYDGETGLHYNTFRDYDPTTGRYIESDPIGLKGGSTHMRMSGESGKPSGSDGAFSNYPDVDYNAPPPQTEPVELGTERQVQCMASCLGQDLTITGGSEPGRHATTGRHPSGNAVDFGSGANPDLSHSACGKTRVNNCARLCGFTHGGWEPDWRITNPHYHFQNGSGARVPQLPGGIITLPDFPPLTSVVPFGD